MTNLNRTIALFMIAILVASCTESAFKQPSQQINTQSITSPAAPSAMPEVYIARHPAPVDISGYYLELTSIPKFDPTEFWKVDLRSRNLTKINMSHSLADLLYATYDSKTQWPSSDKIPAGFDWQGILEAGKDPGLGIRELHEHGINGKGVSIAIIDQPLIVEHIEYGSQIRLYEEINIAPDTVSQMHGPAVASLAAGRTVGVAPDVNLYYIAAWAFDPSDPSQGTDYRFTAQALRRLIDLNKDLPEEQKIRAVSMSIGLNPEANGYDEFFSAIQAVKDEGMFPIVVSLDRTYGWNMLGLGRDARSDPNDFSSYEPASWLKEEFFEKRVPASTLLIPMESRTTASQTGAQDYVFWGQAGMSWTVPYLAGVYALAVQVDPDITPEQFWETALETGRTTQIQHDGKEYEFGVILDPQALIKAVKSQ